MNTNHFKRGQVLIVIALALVGLLGIVALVVDGGNAFQDHRKAQNAVDAAAMAGAYARVTGGGDWVAAAVSAAAQNGYNNDGVKNIVVVYSPPPDGPHSGDVEYLQVILTSHINTYFARVVGTSQITNLVKATARTVPPQIKELLDGRAIVSLAPGSSCISHLSFWVHGEATLDISGGDVFVNSNNRNCALVQNGSGSIRIEDGHHIDVVGGTTIQKTQLITPSVTTGASAVNYPPPFFMPKVGCPKGAEISVDGSSMSAGSWGDEFPPVGVTHLDLGVYCLKKGIKITHDIEGHNVVFKVMDGEIHLDGSAKIILDAPNSGDNAGLLIYVPMDNHKKVVLNAGPGSIIKGTILAPASLIMIKGMDSPTGFHSQIIGYTVEADGSNNVRIVYEDDQNFNSLTMPEVQLSE